MSIKFFLQNLWWRIVPDFLYNWWHRNDPPEYGFSIAAWFDPPMEDEGDVLLFEFIDLIESMDLYCGGGAHPKRWGHHIYGAGMDNEKRKAIIRWFIIEAKASRVMVSDIDRAEAWGPKQAMWYRLEEI